MPADEIVDSLNLQKFTKPKDNVQLRNLKRNHIKNKLKKTLSSSKIKNDFSYQLSALAPSDNMRIDNIINIMKAKNNRSENSFKDSVESLLNESIEKKMTANNYLSNTRESLKHVNKHSQINQSQSIKQKSKNNSKRSISKKSQNGYYDRLKQKKRITQQNKNKIGISHLTPEMHKKVRKSTQKVSLLSQRTSRIINGESNYKSGIKRNVSNNSISSLMSIKKKNSKARKTSIQAISISKKSLSPTNNLQMVIHGRKNNQKMTIEIPKLKLPNAKRGKKEKTSPKIRIMNTKRDNRGDRVKRNNVKKHKKSPSSFSKTHRADSKFKKTIKEAQKKDYTRPGYRMNRKHNRKNNTKTKNVRTPKKFDKLNESDHKKLDEIKKQFQKKFAIETVELNNKNNASKSKGICM